MKKILILALVSLMGCAQNQCANVTAQTEEAEKPYMQINQIAETNKSGVSIVKLRECEYLQTYVYDDGYGFHLYTHLGDCQNPIHHKDTLK